MTQNFDIAKQEMIRLAQELHDGKCAPNSVEFALHGTVRISRRTFYGNFGSWKAWVEWCGLKLESRTYYARAAKARGGLSISAQMELAKVDEEARFATENKRIEGQIQRYRAALDEEWPLPRMPYQEREIYCWRQHRYVPVLIAQLR